MAAAAVALLVTAPAWAEDAVVPDGEKVVAAKTMLASKLTGLNVRNKQDEQLGTVNDIVIDVSNGRVVYIALSVGGVLGVGNKLFAVPYDALQFKYGRDEQVFVMDIQPEKLKSAPGFDQSHWPDFADPAFRQKIDDYYREHRARPDGAVSTGLKRQ
jgi:sporulation protein YlmC with PRC-barrel domain